MSGEDARARIWLPDVTVSNRAPANKIATISSGIQISDDGGVTKIERVMVTAKNQFEVHAFPFDWQTLIVQLGSRTLMADELVFVPLNDTVTTGVDSDLLKLSDFSFMSFDVSVMEQRDATLRKSRAELHIVANRRSVPYIQSLLVPELLVLAISFTVFWFPLKAAFAMPRVGTALIAFLALITLGLRTSTMLPIRGGLAWIELFETCIQTLMFFTVVLNIFVLVVQHSFKEDELATLVNHELKVIFPVMAIICFLICFAKTDGKMLDVMAIIVNQFLLFANLIYVGWCSYRMHKHMQATKEQAALAAAAAAAQQNASQASEAQPAA